MTPSKEQPKFERQIAAIEFNSQNQNHAEDYAVRPMIATLKHRRRHRLQSRKKECRVMRAEGARRVQSVLAGEGKGNLLQTNGGSLAKRRTTENDLRSR
ncbi:hypothetical protein Csa_010031 [Cucumis sativus]|uniref:Uncharacterized protein n=1 Tax=Cucumis sativus TaxID=3659 RepID=A0A0A0L7U6_CUCSA|nr:hypothetical protein Csa_010031 [Cucumis sativus]